MRFLVSAFAAGLLFYASWLFWGCAVDGDTGPSASQNLHGREYYVSANGDNNSDGSLTRPWRSIQRAAAFAQAGDIIHVAEGVYTLPVVTSASGSPSARIRFVSDTQWGAKIITQGAYTVWENKGDYVDIMGFDISGDATLGLLNMGSHVRIVGNKIHHIPVLNCTNDGGAGINNGNYEGKENDVIANVVSNVGDRLRQCPRVHGIYHANHGGHIWNNISLENEGWGIHLWHAADSVVIANNLISQNDEGGILVGAGDAPGDVTADHILVTNNIVVHNGWAIRETGRTGQGNRYRNNVIFQNARGVQLQTGQESGTISTDPKLVNFRATGLRHTGTTEGAPPLDANGAARPPTNPDVGPYQLDSRAASWPWM